MLVHKLGWGGQQILISAIPRVTKSDLNTFLCTLENLVY